MAALSITVGNAGICLEFARVVNTWCTRDGHHWDRATRTTLSDEALLEILNSRNGARFMEPESVRRGVMRDIRTKLVRHGVSLNDGDNRWIALDGRSGALLPVATLSHAHALSKPTGAKEEAEEQQPSPVMVATIADKEEATTNYLEEEEEEEEVVAVVVWRGAREG